MKKLFSLLAVTLALAACGSKENTTGENTGGGSSSTAPAVPAGVQLTASSQTSLSFSWTAVQGATSYHWRLLKNRTEVQRGDTTTPKAEVTGLTASTEYSFSVRSEASSAKSAYSEALTVTTEADDSSQGGDDPTPPAGSIAYEEFQIPSVEEDGTARAFPGAEGGGMWATGGRGGTVYHVTNLNDSGEGSLRWACSQSGPRTIVFDVAGTIALKSQLQIKSGYLTIAGQTAPGDGICIKNYTFRIHASNVIVRFIRCRMGDEEKTEDDAFQIMDKYGDSFHDIIVDHCSISWCTDECASFYGMKDFTFQWNIVSESLRNSIHDKGPHGYGGIWGGTSASYHHNLLAHHDSRNPRIDHDYVSHQKGPVSIFNNVVYNWEGNSCYGGESSSNNGSEYRKYNFFNNYYKPGPVTPTKHIWLLEPTTSCSNCGGTILPGHFWMEGNVLEGQSAVTADNWKAGTASPTGVYVSASVASKIKEEKPFAMDSYQSIHTAAACLDPVLNYAGASFVRDNIDERIARETREGSYTYEGSNTDPKKYDKNQQKWVSVERSYKGLIDTQTDVADGTWKDGWPVYSATAAEVDALRDSDGDGIPDAIETEWGLSKSNRSDGAAKTLDPEGRYTNLEMYLHYLVKDIVAGGNAGATYKQL